MNIHHAKLSFLIAFAGLFIGTVPAFATSAPATPQTMPNVAAPLVNSAEPPAAKTAALPTGSIDFFARFKFCLRSTSRIERLLCYDDVAEEMGLMAPTDREKEERILGTYGFWQVVADQDETGNEQTYLKLDSANKITTDIGVKAGATLTLLCQQHKTDVYVNWKIPLNYAKNVKRDDVTFSIDGQPTVKQVWAYSSDNYAMFAPETAKLIRAMEGHHKIIITMTPASEGASSMIFNLDGFDNVLNILIKRCYGSNPPTHAEE